MDLQRKAVGRAAVALVTIIVVALAVIGLAVAGSQSNGLTTTSSTSTSNSASETSTSGVQSSYGKEGIQVSTPSVARLNPATDLSLHLNLTANANRSVTVRAYDVNTLDRANNITTEDAWPVFPGDGVCITSLVGYVVYQGDYGVGNYTLGTPLDLGGNVPTCPATYYSIFSPMSTAVAIYPSPNEPSDSVKANASISGNVSDILVPGSLPGGALGRPSFPLRLGPTRWPPWTSGGTS